MYDQLWRKTIAFRTDAQYCLQHNFNDFMCRDSWRLVGMVFIAFAVLLAMLMTFFLMRRRRAAQREVARAGKLAELQIAVEREEVKRSRWIGDETVAGARSQAELEAEIRRAVDARRQATSRPDTA